MAKDERETGPATTRSFQRTVSLGVDGVQAHTHEQRKAFGGHSRSDAIARTVTMATGQIEFRLDDITTPPRVHANLLRWRAAPLVADGPRPAAEVVRVAPFYGCTMYAPKPTTRSARIAATCACMHCGRLSFFFLVVTGSIPVKV